MKEIQLAQGQIALVDDEDFNKLNQYKWYALQDNNRDFRAIRSIYLGKDILTGKYISKMLHMAREIMDCPDNMLVDHRDHITLNNQKGNLRICTLNQNQQNKKPHSNCASKYKGVSWRNDRSHWRAYICIRNIFDQAYHKYLGSFKIEEEAAKAYDIAAQHHFEEFAYLNFPDRSSD
jgi:hypothetical protein